MDVLLEAAEITTANVAERTDYPLRTAERALEDLTAHGIAHRNAKGSGKATTWTLTDWATDRYRQALTPSISTSPEMSEDTKRTTSPETSEQLFNPPLRIEEDFSGEVTHPRIGTPQ
jgi:DNA-binding IclR family transcriptional regulator